MSNPKLSAFLQNEVVNIIKSDMRNELNEQIQYLSFGDINKLAGMLTIEYDLKNKPGVAKQMAQWIMNDIDSAAGRSRSFKKTTVEGKTVYMTTTNRKTKTSFSTNKAGTISVSHSKANYGVFKDWKTKMSGRFNTEFAEHLPSKLRNSSSRYGKDKKGNKTGAGKTKTHREAK